MALRRTLRGLWRDTGTSAAVVITIALATGFTSAAAAVVYGVLLRPLPYDHPDRLVVLDHAVPRTEIQAWRERMHTLEELAGAAAADHAVRGLGRARILRVAFVSDRFFATVRPHVLVCRLPAPGEDTAVVVSERALRQDGMAAASALGTRLTAVDRTFSIVGVVPADVGIPDAATDVWLPLAAAEPVPLIRADDRRFVLIGRRRATTTIWSAAVEATRVRQALWTGDPAERSRLRVAVATLDDRARGTGGGALVAFLVGGALMLLIASANVATLLLSRTVARERELAVSVVLGAGAARVAASLFGEALFLSALGSVAGLGLAHAGLRAMRSVAAGALVRLDLAAIDPLIVAFSAAVALLVAAMATLGPAWSTVRRGMQPLVRAAAPARGRRDLQALLAGMQLALSIVLLVAATLLARTMMNVLAVPTGVRVDGVLTARVMLGDRTLLSRPEARAFADRLLTELAALPGVKSAAFATSLPPATSIIEMAMQVIEDGRNETQTMALVAATPRWQETVGARLVEGRFLRPEDADADHPGVVVSRSAARHLFRDRPAIGRSLPTPIPGTGGRQARIVGVVEDVRFTGLAAPSGGSIYVPWQALPFGVVRLVVRTSGDPGDLARPIAVLVRQLDPSRPIEDLRPLGDVVASSVAERRLYALIAVALAATALGVALVGLLATLARVVTLRRREFAVRLAVGATASALARLVVRRASAVVAGGVLVGLPLAWAAAHGLSTYLYGVDASGVDTYVVVALGAAALALLACVWPAWRAFTTSPLDLLRADR